MNLRKTQFNSYQEVPHIYFGEPGSWPCGCALGGVCRTRIWYVYGSGLRVPHVAFV